MAETWTSWSGATCRPARQAHPASVTEVAEEIGLARRAGRRLRVAGSGHSFSPVCLTDGTLLHLDRLAGVQHVDAAAGLVRVGAGMTLSALNAALDEHGLALENLGDIDTQTVAGAIATATHGTGLGKPSLSAQVEAVELVDADGRVHVGDPVGHPALWRAARVSVGVLGVLTAVTLRVVPAYTLRRVDAREPLEAVLEALEDRIRRAEHFELFCFPFARDALTRTTDSHDGPPAPPSPRREAFDAWLTNDAFELVQRAGSRFPATIPTLCCAATRAGGSSERIDRSHRCFASPRRVRFVETEWGVPRAAAADVIRSARAWIAERRYPVAFPMELRFTAPDDAFLGTAHGRESAYLAVHAYAGMPHEELFAAVAAICSEHGGRPHWGKRHDLTAADLAPRYPRWEDFQAVRAALDPEGLFGNEHTDRALGVAGARDATQVDAWPRGSSRGSRSGAPA